MDTVRLTHPKSSRVITVRADMAGMYESQGWVPAPVAVAPKARSRRPAPRPAEILAALRPEFGPGSSSGSSSRSSSSSSS